MVWLRALRRVSKSCGWNPGGAYLERGREAEGEEETDEEAVEEEERTDLGVGEGTEVAVGAVAPASPPAAASFPSKNRAHSKREFFVADIVGVLGWEWEAVVS